MTRGPRRPRDRAPLPRPPPPARPAALAARRARIGPGASSIGSARSSSTRSRSPAATTTWCWLARIAGYRRAWTDDLLYDDAPAVRDLQQGPLASCPTAELPWYRITWDRSASGHEAGVLRASTPTSSPSSSTGSGARARCRRPTSSRARRSTGTGARRTRSGPILEALAEAGILGLARREGNRRVYDLAERLFPADLLAERRPMDEQRRHKLLSRYRAHGLLGRVGGQQEIWIGTGAAKRTERATARRAASCTIELVGSAAGAGRGRGRAGRAATSLAEECRAARAASVGRGRPSRTRRGVAFLAPLDPLVWDRDLLRSLWDFDYVWEVYVPAAKRRWGYYVLPLLWGDRFVGRIEPRIDRQSGRPARPRPVVGGRLRSAGRRPASSTRSPRRSTRTGLRGPASGRVRSAAHAPRPRRGGARPASPGEAPERAISEPLWDDRRPQLRRSRWPRFDTPTRPGTAT